MRTEGKPPVLTSHADMDDELQTQAAQWWARLEAAPADAPLAAQFEAWLARSARHRLAFAELASLGYALTQMDPERPLGSALAVRRVIRRSAAPLWRWSGAVLAALLLAFGWLLLPHAWQNWRADQLSAVGQRTRSTLDDGSVLQLDTDTAVIVHLLPDRRELELLRGALYVEVQPDAARPFTVRAGARSATALGTAFSVDFDSGRVAVSHGLVRVQEASARADVPAGRTAEPDSKGWRLHASAAQAPDWTRGQRVFEQVPLRVVLEALDRYLPGRMWLRDAPALSRPVTAVLNLDDPERALAQLCAAHQLAVHHWPGVIVIEGQ